MTKSSQKIVLDARIDHGAFWFPSNIAADWTIAPSYIWGSVVKINHEPQRPGPNFDALRMWHQRGRLDTPHHRLNLHIKGLMPHPYLEIFGHCMTKNLSYDNTITKTIKKSMTFYYDKTIHLWPIVDSLSSYIYCSSSLHTLHQLPASLFMCLCPNIHSPAHVGTTLTSIQ